MKYSIHVRCSCTRPDGKPAGQDCPRLWRKDGSWNARHGSAGFACRVATSAGVKPVKRYGFESKAAAEAVAQHAGKLLDLAAADEDTRARIGDMIISVRRGGQLPAVEDVRRRLGLGLDPASAGITVGEWLDTWLAGRQRVKRPSTARSYEMHVRVWLKPQLGHLPLERLNSGHIEGLFTTIERFNAELERQRSEGRALIEIEGDVRSQPRIVGPSTQARIFATLRAACNAAVRQRKIRWSPCAGIELEPGSPAEARRWTPAEAARFIAFSADDPMGLMFRVAVLRGARRGELCGFTWPGTDLDAGVITVQATVLQLGGRVVAGTPKTKAGVRKIFLDQVTAGLLREHHDAQVLQALEADTAWQDSGLVFCRQDGTPWNPDHVSRRFKRLAAEAGVPVIKLHEGGRHTGNSLMRDAGVDQDIRMREVGHSDRSVNDRYTHVLEDAHFAAAEQVAELVRKAGGAA
ncbi:MAG: site-specific integrase [Actinomycetota bacterium]|nr:site-specific integrase [Actinomycetota bacterium]